MSNPRSPFDITEIAELIFSHIDDVSYRRTVPFVCRQWFLLSKGRCLRQLAWDNRWGTRLEPVLAKLPGVGRFICCHRGLEGGAKVRKQLFLALKNYSQRYYEGFQQRGYFSQPASCRLFYMSLRELDLRVDFIEGDQLDYIKYPSSLTSLKLDLRNVADKRMELGILFRQCPLLEVFHAGRVGEFRIKSAWHPLSPNVQKPLVLRSLVLRDVAYDQWELETLLKFTPRLQELKLIGIQSRSRSVNDRFEIFSLDSNAIYTLIRKLSLPIDSYHFSIVDRPARDGEPYEKLHMFPRPPSEWSFWAPELEPFYMEALELTTNNVTTLDVYWDQTNRYEQPHCNLPSAVIRQLHQFLCSSPQLLSLKVANAAILLEAMDLHRRSGYIDPECGVMFTRSAELEETVVRPGIWACRGLRQLSIEVHSHRLFELTAPVHSRIVFGYISRVCPILELLEVTVPAKCRVEPQLGFTNYVPVLFGRLDGGLCLLSKLKKLRTLKVLAQDVWKGSLETRRDALNWIHSSGHDTKSRMKRRGVVAGWKSGIDTEKRTEMNRASVGPEGDQYWTPSAAGTIEPELTKQLEKLGLLSDVKEMVEEMDVDDFRCMPELELFSFGGELARSPEEFLGLLEPRRFWIW
ncbi:hypothetical protein EC991_008369 [Linnemannia zychae]|nr:hypothetical protein EC991_008369 [Linnemannia zychae]